MHMMKTYENLRDMLEREVTEIEQKGQLDGQSLEYLFKLMGTIKNVDKCMGYEEGNSYGRMMPEMSYARDRYGRYSGDNFRDSSYRGRSYDGRSYDRENARQKMIDRLNMLMDEATNDNERQAIMDCMNKI